MKKMGGNGIKELVKKGLGEMGFNSSGGAINWFPGHMAAATRAIRERLRLADMVIEVRDARIPLSSANLDLQNHLSSKRRLIALNKKDLANPNIMQVILFCFCFSFIFTFSVSCASMEKGLIDSYNWVQMLIGSYPLFFVFRNGFVILIRASKIACL